jgi:hypothetical protein
MFTSLKRCSCTLALTHFNYLVDGQIAVYGSQTRKVADLVLIIVYCDIIYLANKRKKSSIAIA